MRSSQRWSLVIRSDMATAQGVGWEAFSDVLKITTSRDTGHDDGRADRRRTAVRAQRAPNDRPANARAARQRIGYTDTRRATAGRVLLHHPAIIGMHHVRLFGMPLEVGSRERADGLDGNSPLPDMGQRLPHQFAADAPSLHALRDLGVLEGPELGRRLDLQERHIVRAGHGGLESLGVRDVPYGHLRARALVVFRGSTHVATSWWRRATRALTASVSSRWPGARRAARWRGRRRLRSRGPRAASRPRPSASPPS